MKKAGIFALVFLMVGAFAFAQEEGSLSGNLGIGFILNLDKDPDADLIVSPGLDLAGRVYLMDFGNEFQPFKVGAAIGFSYNFVDAMTWKIPEPKQKKTGANAFWSDIPAGNEGAGTIGHQIGSQYLRPGQTYTYSKKAGDFDKDNGDSLVNGALMIGLAFNIGLADSVTLALDVGYIGSLNWATFGGYAETNIGGTQYKEKIELQSFISGIALTPAIQYTAGALYFEFGVGLNFFVSRTDSVDWYYVKVADGERAKEISDERGWKEEGLTESIGLFRAAPFLMIGLSF